MRRQLPPAERERLDQAFWSVLRLCQQEVKALPLPAATLERSFFTEQIKAVLQGFSEVAADWNAAWVDPERLVQLAGSLRSLGLPAAAERTERLADIGGGEAARSAR